VINVLVKLLGVSEARGALMIMQQRVESPPGLRQVGLDLVNEFGRRIKSGAFAPLSEATRLIRAKRGQTGPPLSASGELVRSLDVVGLEKNTVYMGSKSRNGVQLLRFGGITAAGSAIPGKRVPPRDFLEVLPPALYRAAETILDSIASGL
jgi:hypothetical protein